MRKFVHLSAWSLLTAVSSPAIACGEPSPEWYQKVSDAVIDGTARCDAEQRSCRVRITSVVKDNGYALARGQSLDLDFVEFEFIENSENLIIYSCGGPLFEPEFARFSGRFYLNVDEVTGDVIVRRHRIRGQDGQLWREHSCTEADGEFQCSYE